MSLRISRRRFLYGLGYISILPLVLLTGSLLRFKRENSPKREMDLIQPNPGAAEIQEGILLVRDKSGSPTQAFSAQCTHLGCRIAEIQQGVLVCPCHGSRFDLQGKPISGPAAKSLRKLEIIDIMEDGRITIRI